MVILVFTHVETPHKFQNCHQSMWGFWIKLCWRAKDRLNSLGLHDLESWNMLCVHNVLY